MCAVCESETAAADFVEATIKIPINYYFLECNMSGECEQSYDMKSRQYQLIKNEYAYRYKRPAV